MEKKEEKKENFILIDFNLDLKKERGLEPGLREFKKCKVEILKDNLVNERSILSIMHDEIGRQDVLQHDKDGFFIEDGKIDYDNRHIRNSC